MFWARTLAALLLLCGVANAQTSGTFVANQVLTAAQLNAALALKSDYPGCATVGGLTACQTITQQPSGTAAAAFTFLNSFTFTNWNVNAGANNIAANSTRVTVNGASAQAQALFSYMTDMQFTADANVSSRSVYGAFLARGVVNQSPLGANFYMGGENCNLTGVGGIVWPAGSQLICNEADLAVNTSGLTGRAFYKAVLADTTASNVQGSSADAVLWASTPIGSTAFGVKNGILLDGTQGKIIATNGCVLCVAGTQTVTSGIIFTGWSFTGNIFQGGGVIISGTGSLGIQAQPLAPLHVHTGTNQNLLVNSNGNLSFTAINDAVNAVVPFNIFASYVQYGNSTSAPTHLVFGQITKPTVSTCGTGATAAGSTDTAGQVTATGAAACTVIFNVAYNSQPYCVATDNSNANSLKIVYSTGVNFTVSGLTAGDTFSYICLGQSGG